MGDALKSWPVLKCHSGLPVCASRASKELASSPKKSKPPAVVIVPPEEWAWRVSGYRKRTDGGRDCKQAGIFGGVRGGVGLRLGEEKVCLSWISSALRRNFCIFR